MRIVFANGRQTYPLFRGGDGISIHEILTQFGRDGHGVTVLGKINPTTQPATSTTKVTNLLKKHSVEIVRKKNGLLYQNEGYKAIMIESNYFKNELINYLKSGNPDIVLTQLENSNEVINICHSMGIKTICFIHDHDPLNFQVLNISNKAGAIIFNSKSTKRHYSQYCKCLHKVIYPGINFKNYITKRVHNKYILFINPINVKGAQIVNYLINKFPQENFMIVKGWKPMEFGIENRKNIKIIERSLNMRPIYSNTKLLLVPSQWEESFGRIIPEAGINNIPSLSSRIGGIPEAVGKGGILVDDFTNATAWENILREMLGNDNLLKKYGKLAFKQARKFDFNIQYQKLINTINTIYSS